MNEEIKELLLLAYRELLEIPYKVLEIFSDFYGEERVDFYSVITENEFLHYLSHASMLDIMKGFNYNYGIPAFKNTSYYVRHPNPQIYSDFIDDAHKPIAENAEYVKKYIPYLLPFINPTLQDDFGIIVHFPKVKVENEYGRSVDVEDYWVVSYITKEGQSKGWFKMNRSTYSLIHLQSDYMH